MIRAVLPPNGLPTAAELEALAPEAWRDVCTRVATAGRPVGFPDCWAHARRQFTRWGQTPPPGARAIFARAVRLAWRRVAAWEATPQETEEE